MQVIASLKIERAIEKETGYANARISRGQRIRGKMSIILLTLVCALFAALYLHSLYAVQSRMNEIL